MFQGAVCLGCERLHRVSVLLEVRHKLPHRHGVNTALTTIASIIASAIVGREENVCRSPVKGKASLQ